MHGFIQATFVDDTLHHKLCSFCALNPLSESSTPSYHIHGMTLQMLAVGCYSMGCNYLALPVLYHSFLVK